MRKDKLLKKLHNKASKLWKEICHMRDGDECQVRKFYPHIRIIHTNVMQIDHCFSRTNKHLFYRIENGTKVCSSCNFNKKFRNHGVDIAIEEIVKMREGVTCFNKMREEYLQSAPNTDWNNPIWLEQIILELESKRSSLINDINNYSAPESLKEALAI